MKTLDLQEEFINALSVKIPKKADLENKISDILRIEKDSAYRRLSGKVNFSIREMGVLAKEFGISLDCLLRNNMEYLWVPLLLEQPQTQMSMDSLCDVMEAGVDVLSKITEEPTEAGCLYNSLPPEFFVHFPTLAKFMFFKWGHYFIGTEEFHNFSKWEIPERVLVYMDKLKKGFEFEKMYYIWDNSLIWNVSWELDSLCKMHIVTQEEKNTIKEELKELLKRIEGFLNGNYVPHMRLPEDVDFFVSTVSMGFIACYYDSKERHSVSFRTSFSFAVVDDCDDSFYKMKEWIDSLKRMSTMLSKGGRIERRLFFETQFNTIDHILG